MRDAPPPVAQGVTHELHAYREPAGGDYVAYLAELERRQLVQLAAAHPRLASALKPAQAHRSGDTRVKPAAADGAAMQARLEIARHTIGKFNTGQVVAALIGLMLVLGTLIGEGNVVALLIGIALLWTPIQRVLRGVRESGPAPNRAMIDTHFGKPDKRP